MGCGQLSWLRWAVVSIVLAAAGCGDAATFDTDTAKETPSTAGTGGTAVAGTGGSGDGGAGAAAGASSGGVAGTAGAAGSGAEAGSGGATGTGSGSGGDTTGVTGSAPCVSDQQCDDGVFCNGSEACAADGTCVAGSAPCDDGVACTVDVCDEAAGDCTQTPDDALCDDGIACNGAETCHALFGCQSTGALDCDDGVGCTADFCDPQSGLCVHQPSDAKCADDVFCDGVETCDPAAGDPVTGCAEGTPVECADGVACTKDFCDEAAKSCHHTADDTACDDGLFCNGPEACAIGFGCVAGQPPNCSDALSCTLDACDEAAKSCSHAPNHAACDDGLDCNGKETCSAGGPVPSGCLAGTPVPCAPDAFACTYDACDEDTNQCEHTPLNALCGAGHFCVPAAGGCTIAPPCQTAADCDDGDACNGVETCNVVCQPGQPVDCNDGVGCTVDSCNAATGTCSHTPNQAACDDGYACNGVETCDPAAGDPYTGCVQGTSIACDDGVACTQDVCTEPSGACVSVPDDWQCSDGQLCNGMEVCDPLAGCQPGTPYVCPSDGIACTTEVCDPAANGCKIVPDDGACPCGQTCSAQNGGCGNFCQVSTCQGKVYACGDCIDNDGDCDIDSADTQCLGPCDNTEAGLYGGIPGQNNSPCKSDCYFDQDTGSGNDDCYWSHKCDPLEVGPDYPPEGSQCAYNMSANIPGYGGTCSDAFATQSTTCQGYCGPLTPNGCDCFGCCTIPGAPTPVWLGSENPAGTGSCTLADIADPQMCKPCTQVGACLNTCEHCEICVGKPDLPPDCTTGQECTGDSLPCGQPGQPPCSAGFTCITGCCQPNPN